MKITYVKINSPTNTRGVVTEFQVRLKMTPRVIILSPTGTKVQYLRMRLRVPKKTDSDLPLFIARPLWQSHKWSDTGLLSAVCSFILCDQFLQVAKNLQCRALEYCYMSGVPDSSAVICIALCLASKQSGLCLQYAVVAYIPDGHYRY